MMRATLSALAGCLLLAAPAAAQILPVGGFTSLPSFAWAEPSGIGPSPFEGSYARVSSGFEVSSSRRFGTLAGPTFGFEGGRMWRDGQLVYGVVGAFDALAPIGGFGRPGLGGLSYTRDIAGAIQFKAGALVAEDVLLYTKLGLGAVHETFRLGPNPVSSGVTRDDLALVPDARIGAEWAVTDRLSVAVEVGVARQGLR